MKHTVTIALFCFLFTPLLNAQSGCTDPQANNYDASATVNDGSCLYETTVYTMGQRATLPEMISECSGLAFFNGQLWGHNDSFMPNYIHQIDTTTGEVLRSVLVSNYSNEDWEDFAESETDLFIGDFGNNFGTRTNLSIGRVAKSDLVNDSIVVELIEFVYEDQTDFSENYNNHNFDCEAFFYLNDSLHLFTKNWTDNTTKHYVIPAIPGMHTAILVESFDVEGLISGADIQENGVINLLGYKADGTVFMWLLFDYQESLFFSGNKRKISLGTGISNSIPEGIAFSSAERGFVGSEAYTFLPARLLTFSIGQWITDYVTNTKNIIDDKHLSISIMPNPFINHISIGIENSLIERVTVMDVLGKIHFVKTINGTALEMDLGRLQKGNYVLKIDTNEGILVRMIQKN